MIRRGKREPAQCTDACAHDIGRPRFHCREIVHNVHLVLLYITIELLTCRGCKELTLKF